MNTNKMKEIYPLDNEIDSQLISNLKNKNWAEMYILWKNENLLKRYISLIKNSDMENFILGVQYEYGVNNTKQDLKKAYDIYLSSALKTFDTLSMYRIHLIHLKEYEKFNIKRDRILEKYFLFKSFCYSSFDINNSDNLFSYNIDIKEEINLNLELEDNYNLDKFKSLINFLKYNKKYQTEIRIIHYVEGLIMYYFGKNEEDIKKGKEILKNIAKNNYHEAFYKLICINEPKDKQFALESFKFLEKYNYYRCYANYGKLLFEEFKDVEKSLKILKLGYENKNFDCLIYYIDVFSYHINNFEKQNANIYLNIMELILDSILIGEKYSFFEFIYLRKILIEKFDKKEEFDNRFLPYLKEIVAFLISTIEYNKIDFIKDNFQIESDSELNFVLGVLYYYGVDDVIVPDFQKSLKYIKTAYKILDTLFYKRFLYSYVYKIKKKLYNQKKITEEKFKKTEKKLFKMFYDSLDKAELDSFSSSFLYYIGKLYMKGIGTKKDLTLSYCFIDKAKTEKLNIGYGSIISHYRSWKSNKKLLENELQSVEKMLNNLDLKNDNESYGEEGNICGICYTNKRNKVIIPCFHKICSNCIKNIKDKCPFCRGKIFFIKEIKN